MTKRTPPYSPEGRERAVRMVFDHQGEQGSQWAAIQLIAAEIDCSGETLRKWLRQSEKRPAAPKDQRTAPAYIFGAICPARDVGASLVMPRCTTSAMAHHLEEIAKTVASGARAVLLLDRAGWHTTKKPPVPDNITLLPFPARSPELNPVENLWHLMRENCLVLCRNPRALLRRLEQAHRPGLAHQVHRTAPMGPCVLINGNWYSDDRTPGRTAFHAGPTDRPSTVDQCDAMKP